MMKSIIEIIEAERQAAIEGEVLRAVQRIGVNVDKDRLIQALTDARKFYDEGYQAARANSAGRWISVKDRLPEPTENPVLAAYHGLANTAWFHGELWEFPAGFLTKEVTHWMPLPELPKEET